MGRSKRISVQSKSKSWSFGVFIAAVVWLVGEWQFSWGSELWWLIVCLVLAPTVDTFTSGSSSEKGVYIE